MIHAVEIDEKEIKGKKPLNKIRGNNCVVCIPTPKANSVTPEGYMTIEEFRKEAKKSLTKILNGYGVY